MTKKIITALNKQIQEELYSAYLYQAMAAYASYKNLDGLANWFTVQAKEEMDHATGFYNFILERGGQVELKALAQPPLDFGAPLNMFKEALKHEQHITGTINKLFELATQEKDYACQSFLKWYIDEQVEEEDNATRMIEKLKMIGSEGQALYMFDQELAQRTYTPASIVAPTA